MAKQMITGKAFEYALLCEFYERLTLITKIDVITNEPYKTAQRCFFDFSEKEKGEYRVAASSAINFLIDIEPRLSNGIADNDVLQLEIVSDVRGQKGDVRDVLAIRAMQKWEIGISAKNNHHAVKHPRLSNTIDFGKKWLGVPCSTNYFANVKPIFDRLSMLRKQNHQATWNDLGDYHTSVYVPILDAFRDELLSLDKQNPGVVARNLVEYLIGKQDFYKIIKSCGKVEIQVYNIHGSLNSNFEKIKPKAKLDLLKLPSRLIEVVYAENNKTTLLVSLNEGWQISFRIHNASSKVQPSLKFDINLISTPRSLFTQTQYLNI